MRVYTIKILKFFYYLLPKLIREQYRESLFYYMSLFRSSRLEADGRRLSSPEAKINIDVRLIEDIESLASTVLWQKKDSNAKVHQPQIYVDGSLCERRALSGSLPDVKVVQLYDVKVVGGTDAVISGKKMFHHELSLIGSIHDMKRPGIFVPRSDKNQEKDIGYGVNCIKSSDAPTDSLTISLLKEHSVNYYHWTTEVMPKLVEITKHLCKYDRPLVILIDKGVPKQALNIATLILDGYSIVNYEFREVAVGELVSCNDLIYCTPFWTSLDNTRHIPNPKKEFFVSEQALKSVFSAISSNITSSKVELQNKKIYLQRQNNKLRKITNIIELERLLYKHGFDFVDPAALDFQEQYDLFSQADIVLGVSGAAFTNLLFMKEGSLAISLYPSAQSTNYYVFQPLADVSGVNLIHFLTDPVGESNSVHSDASINIEQLDKLLGKTIS